MTAFLSNKVFPRRKSDEVRSRRRAGSTLLTLGLLLSAAACGTETASPFAANLTSSSSSSSTSSTAFSSSSSSGEADEDLASTAAPAETAPTASPPSPEAATTDPVPPASAPEADSPEITAADVLERNSLYAIGALQDAGCAPVADIPLDSVDNVRAFYTSILPCLDATWAQIAPGTDIPARPAGLQVFTGPSVGSCLEGATYSFYCTGDETIYMYADEIIQPWIDYPTDYSHGITALAAIHTLAHEYGHHIQNFTGIFAVLDSDFGGTEAERRLELQASCLANVFLASQAGAYPIAPEYIEQEALWRFITRVPNHGSEANQAFWTSNGYQSASPAQCNTFSATPDQVA